MEEILFKWIPSVGFPIVVAAFVLIRIEPKLARLIEAVTELVPLVKQETQNSKNIKDALTDFRVEVSRINGVKK